MATNQMGYTAHLGRFSHSTAWNFTHHIVSIVGSFMDKVDLRSIVSIGFIVFAFVHFWISNFNTQIPASTIAFIRFIQGIGAPCFFIPTITILLSGFPKKRLASATGLSNFCRILAGSFGTSISITLWDRSTSISSKQIGRKRTRL